MVTKTLLLVASLAAMVLSSPHVIRDAAPTPPIVMRPPTALSSQTSAAGVTYPPAQAVRDAAPTPPIVIRPPTALSSQKSATPVTTPAA